MSVLGYRAILQSWWLSQPHSSLHCSNPHHSHRTAALVSTNPCCIPHQLRPPPILIPLHLHRRNKPLLLRPRALQLRHLRARTRSLIALQFRRPALLLALREHGFSRPVGPVAFVLLLAPRPPQTRVRRRKLPLLQLRTVLRVGGGGCAFLAQAQQQDDGGDGRDDADDAQRDADADADLRAGGQAGRGGSGGGRGSGVGAPGRVGAPAGGGGAGCGLVRGRDDLAVAGDGEFAGVEILVIAGVLVAVEVGVAEDEGAVDGDVCVEGPAGAVSERIGSMTEGSCFEAYLTSPSKTTSPPIDRRAELLTSR